MDRAGPGATPESGTEPSLPASSAKAQPRERTDVMAADEGSPIVINVVEPGEPVSGSFAAAFGLDLDRADLHGFHERLSRIDESERAAGRVAATVQLH